MLHTFLKIILRIISTLRFNPVAPQKQCSLRRFNVRINILHVKWRSLLFCFSNSTLTTTTGTPEPPVLLSSCNITALTSLESGGPYGTIWTWLMGQVENEKPKKNNLTRLLPIPQTVYARPPKQEIMLNGLIILMELCARFFFFTPSCAR